ncbi:bifunctional diguanylate cyclase/phosphodiesterase [Hydrogenimonas cancrithermarum]|uniref:GGDEF domain-containing protein n=1 Tax=Hydrogenimonas cancrithermarum TaxID=2993563 RepID=A0ABM8FIC4_9BACT|nr:diguanylate cyclase [Hydrogenimonas cancrithermarum]BDY12041.1 GGDEF domain-containing protein [Hydrogenimonas cancrithermarum]
MTLYKQIGIYVSVLLLLLLGGVLGINFFKTKSYIEEQLNVQAKNTAFALSLSIGAVNGEKEKVREIIDTLFESGAYSLIEFESMERLPVYRKTKEPDIGNVPFWFADFVGIHTMIAENFVDGKNRSFGVVLVRADKADAYTQLFELFKYTLYLFIFFGVLGLVILHFVLGILLRSLENIRNQAEGISHNRFIIQKELPTSPELKNVVITMNSMVKRVKELYERSSEAMKKCQDTLYYDYLTGLFNRRYFQVKLPEYLLANDSRSRGVLVLIRINGIPYANKRVGHKRVDDIFMRFTSILQKSCEMVHEPIICRINGTEFGLVLPVYNAITAKDLAENIIKDFLVLSDRSGLREVLYLSIGICEYVRKSHVSELLSCADAALSQASLYHENRIVAFDGSDRPAVVAGKMQWRQIISKSLKEGRLQPHFDPIVDLKTNKEVSYTLSFNIAYESKILKYGDYVPVVIELGMEYDLMNFEIEYMKQHHFSQQTISFELIADMLEESDKFFHFEKSVKEISKNIRGRLFVEISEYDLLSLDPIVVERISAALRRSGIRFGINHFSAENGDYSYLKYTAPAYIKMHTSLYLDLDTASQNALLTLLASLDIQLIITGVSKEEIPHLMSASIRYVMFA